jgi:hypothetical protein
MLPRAFLPVSGSVISAISEASCYRALSQCLAVLLALGLLGLLELLELLGLLGLSMCLPVLLGLLG